MATNLVRRLRAMVNLIFAHALPTVTDSLQKNWNRTALPAKDISPTLSMLCVSNQDDTGSIGVALWCQTGAHDTPTNMR